LSVILIVEDVPALRGQYAYDLARLGGYGTREAAGVDEALEILAREVVDCVLLDLEMPDRDGFELLDELRKAGAVVPVIVYTGTGDYARCVRAVKAGAASFLDKAEPMERVLREIGNTLERSRLRGEVRALRRQLDDESSLVGDSPALRTLRERISTLAPIPSAVLVLGESGTGKELVARDLHRLSPRAPGPFVAVNCAALPENLVESELFGHERGAFTGADRVRRGAFESAAGGTLFLDEVGELPLPAQAKLLRVLEDGKLTRVGGEKPFATDARVVAATNRDLDAAVREKTFREDLLYRLNVHVIPVPPLRDRLSDIDVLVKHFLALTAKRFGTRAKGVTPAALEALRAHAWRRNNVRELRNVVERMVIASPGETIDADAVPGDAAGRMGAEDAAVLDGSGTLLDAKAAAERIIVLRALERNGWHVTNTAAALGLSDHASLSKIMKRHGIRKPGRKEG
jgi:DNA-binding NtrC family response regulator